jgi:hypothetical protein
MIQQQDTAVQPGQQQDQGPTPEQLALQSARLDALSITLTGKRQKALDARISLGIDQRWLEDVEAYEGRDELTRILPGLRAQVQGYIQQQPDSRKPKRSTLVVNVTRSKVNAAAARLEDIALPSDDRNWDLRPSTIPALVSQMFRSDIGITQGGAPLMIQDGDQQRQVTAADLATQTMEEAKKRAQAMRDEIDDQLDLSDNGCGYEGVVRQVIDDAALLGVGIIKGPIVTSRTKKVWLPVTAGGKTIHMLSHIQDLKPMSSRVDPWDFYPAQDCGENVKKGSGTWERMRFTAKDLRDLADVPGYLIDRIKRVLIEGPRKAGEKPTDKPNSQMVDEDTIFEGWEFHGELARDDLEAAGCKCGDEDVFKSYSSCVIMVNETVIKADIEILDTGELPYDVFTWEKASGIWAGYGVAFLARSAARAITAGWRSMLDNAGQTVGPQVVVNRQVIEPADGVWEVSGRKIWWLAGDGDEADAHKAFALHEISSHQQDFEKIIHLGLKFLDEETSLPMLAQGEKGTAPDRVGVAHILINAANTVLRKKLKNFDDQVTIPHIGRYVDWNMQYSPKADIKGDFEVQARASGALMERDMQNQGAASLLQLASNPAYAHGIKKWNAVRRVVQALRFDPNDFVEDDNTIKKKEEELAKQGPQIDPKEQLRAETDLQVAKLRLQDAQEQRDADRERIAGERDIRMLEYANKYKLSLEQVRAKLAEVVIRERGTNARFAAESRLRETTGAGI